jgi:hypothetical protein
MLPSDFFRRNVVLSFQEDAIGIRLRDVIGVDNMMWGSDYPHSESTFPRSRKILAEILEGVPDDEQAKPAPDPDPGIAGGNTARVYNFDVARGNLCGSTSSSCPCCSALPRHGELAYVFADRYFRCGQLQPKRRRNGFYPQAPGPVIRISGHIEFRVDSPAPAAAARDLSQRFGCHAPEIADIGRLRSNPVAVRLDRTEDCLDKSGIRGTSDRAEHG